MIRLRKPRRRRNMLAIAAWSVVGCLLYVGMKITSIVLELMPFIVGSIGIVCLALITSTVLILVKSPGLILSYRTRKPQAEIVARQDLPITEIRINGMTSAVREIASQ